MNLQRYKWPVIVAAGLHGALFMSFPDGPIPARTPPDKSICVFPVDLTDPVPPAPRDDPADTQPVTELPRGTPRPDIPDDILPAKDPKFTVPLEESNRTTRHDITVIGPPGPIDGTGTGDWNPVSPSIVTATMLDRVPHARVQMAPDYPAHLRQAGIEGAVTVEFEVDAAGSVVTARVVRSSHREFEAPALRAVLRWRFEPGRRFGRAVPFRMTIPIQFSISAD